MLLAKFLCPTSLHTPHSTGVTHMYTGNYGFQSRSIESFRGLSQTLQSCSGLLPQIGPRSLPSFEFTNYSTIRRWISRTMDMLVKQTVNTRISEQIPSFIFESCGCFGNGGCFGNVWVFDNCVGVLVICVLVVTVFCIVCTVFLYCFVYVYLFLFVLFVLI